MGSNEVVIPSADISVGRGVVSEAAPARRRARASRALALVAWDAVVPSALLATGAWLTGASTHFDARLGFLPAISILTAVVALLALLGVGAYAANVRPAVALLPRLAFAAGVCLLGALYIGGRTGWPLDANTLALAFAALPFAWWLGRAALPATAAPQRVLVIGSGRTARQVALLATRHADAGLEVVGCLDDEPLDGPGALPCLGPVGDLDRILRTEHIDRVIVTFTRHSDELVMSVIRRCDEHGVEVDAVPRLFELMAVRPRTYDVGEMALVRLGGGRPGVGQRTVKRGLDIVASGFLLIFFAPVMAACAIAVFASGGRPILFTQARIGREGRPFRILKFRTMVRDADAIGLARISGLKDGDIDIADAVAALKQKDDPRVTRVGGLLRRTSLDELPQLWNVLIGDMSLVGPRPLRSFECDALSDWELRRQGMRPGITGLWQVTSRSDADWDERMRLDYRYVRHWSLATDARILARTITTVLAKKGAV